MSEETKFWLGLKWRVFLIGAIVIVLWVVFDHTFGLVLDSARHHDYLAMFFAAMAGSWVTMITAKLKFWPSQITLQRALT